MPLAERAALLALYESTNGDAWIARDGWGGPHGTECDWPGVSCGSTESERTVTGLHLIENNLAGPLPRALDDLRNLEELLILGNRITGTVPPKTLAKFDEGSLRFLGYAGQFSAVSIIKLTERAPSALCGDYEATIRANGAASLARKKCRNATPEDRATFWERSEGFVNRYTGDVDRLARLSEILRFDELEREYSRAITHGGTVTITLERELSAPLVVDEYASSAPARFWLMKRAIAGALFNAEWETTTQSEVVME